jgi:hypothetical protein
MDIGYAGVIDPTCEREDTASRGSNTERESIGAEFTERGGRCGIMNVCKGLEGSFVRCVEGRDSPVNPSWASDTKRTLSRDEFSYCDVSCSKESKTSARGRG